MCKKYLSVAASDRGSSMGGGGGGGGGGASVAGFSRDGGRISGLIAEFSEDDGGGMGR